MSKSKAQDIEFSGGYNVLMLRAEEGNLDDVKKILTENPHYDINATNKNGSTALALATKSGYYGIVQTLIKAGADVNIKNNSGQTPLFLACWHNHESIAKLLIENGAEINETDQRGWTPLMIATYHGHKEIVRLLIDNKANAHIQDCFGKKAIDRTRDPEIIKLLETTEEVIANEYAKNGAIQVNPYSPKFSPKTRYASTQASGIFSSKGGSANKPRLSSAHRDVDKSILRSHGFLSPQNTSMTQQSFSRDREPHVTSFAAGRSTSRHKRTRSETRQSFSSEKPRAVSPMKSILSPSSKGTPRKKTNITQISTNSPPSPSLKRKFFKEEMQKLLTDHMSYVSEKIQNLVQQKISLEVPLQVSHYEDKLKKELESLLRGRANTLYKNMQSIFNLKLKFLINRLGYDNALIDLTPFTEDDNLQLESIGFTSDPIKLVEEKEARALEKDISKLEKSLVFSRINPNQTFQSFTGLDTSAMGGAGESEIGFRSYNHKLQLKNEIIEQLNSDVRSTTEYLVEYSNTRINEVVRSETTTLHRKIMGELNANLDNIEEQLKNKFEEFISKKIAELANALGNNAQNRSRSPQKYTPTKLASGSSGKKESASMTKLKRELDRAIPDDKERDSQQPSAIRQSFRSPDTRENSYKKLQPFSQTRERIEQIKSSLNFMDEDSNRKPARSEFDEPRTVQPSATDRHRDETPVHESPYKPRHVEFEAPRERSRGEYEPPLNTKDRIEELKAYYQKKYANQGRRIEEPSPKMATQASYSSLRSPTQQSRGNIPGHRLYSHDQGVNYDFSNE